MRELSADSLILQVSTICPLLDIILSDGHYASTRLHILQLIGEDNSPQLNNRLVPRPL